MSSTDAIHPSRHGGSYYKRSSCDTPPAICENLGGVRGLVGSWGGGRLEGGPQWVRFASPQLAPTAPAPWSSLLPVQCNGSLFFVIAVRVFNGWG